MIGNAIAGFLGAGVAASTNSYESIQTSTVGAGGASSISFTSIPATFTHLQIRALAKNSENASGSGYLVVQFNSDTATNYSYHDLYGSGSTVTASGAASTTFVNGGFGIPRSNASAANMFGGSIIDILDYANTSKYKTTRSFNGADTNNVAGATYIDIGSGSWRNTNAITSITITASNGFNHTQYSSFALYGIKGA
jgi:hypothetical protein